MSAYRLYKKERLCSVTAINALFGRDADSFTCAAFPIRAFWRYDNDRYSDAPIQFLISIPKKKLRHAVDRVTMRRRIREAYRLSHQDYALPEGVKINIAFVYVDSKLHSYARVNRSVHRLLDHITREINEGPSANQ